MTAHVNEGSSMGAHQRNRGSAEYVRLPEVKNPTWYAIADQAQCAARRALIHRLGGRRDESSNTLTSTDAIHSARRAGHNPAL
jgi:hypothetical protein